MRSKVKNITVTAAFAALVFVFTFVVKIPTTTTGYVHVGDAVVYIAASVLSTPYAMLAAGIGGALSDVLGGYTAYALPTFIIKAALCLCFKNKSEKLCCKGNLFAVIIASVISIAGYYLTYVFMLAFAAKEPLAELFTVAPWIGSVATIFDNLVQAIASGLIYFVIIVALDKIKFKDMIAKL